MISKQIHGLLFAMDIGHEISLQSHTEYENMCVMSVCLDLTEL